MDTPAECITIEDDSSPPLFPPPPYSPWPSPTIHISQIIVSPLSPLFISQTIDDIYATYNPPTPTYSPWPSITTHPTIPSQINASNTSSFTSQGQNTLAATDEALIQPFAADAITESQYEPESITRLLAYSDGAELAMKAKEASIAQRDLHLKNIRANREIQWMNLNKKRQLRAQKLRDIAELDAKKSCTKFPIPTATPEFISKRHDKDALNIAYNERAFLNMTPLQIPDQVKVILSFGPKFSIPIHPHKNEKEIEMLEETLNCLNDIYLAPYEAISLNIMLRDILAHEKVIDATHPTSDKRMQAYLSSALKDTIRLFKETPGLMIAQADKSNQAIIMFTQDYLDKCKALLSDTSTYHPINWAQSSLEGLKKRNKVLLSRLVSLGHISTPQIKQILNEEKRTANFYALIKTHKEGQPARPIVNTRATPGYFLSKQLNKMLNPMIEFHKYNIKNSAELMTFLKHIYPGPKEKFFSFDIKNMFTSVSPDMSIKSFKRRLSKSKHFSSADTEFILDAMRFTTQHATEVTFDGQLYKQINGLRMGSSCSNICSDVVIEDILDATFRDIPKPALFAKYIDDIICLTTDDVAAQILTSLNSHCPRIQFEIESELTLEDGTGSINFLDVNLINHHDYSPISSKWYQKSIASGRFLNFLSCHHPQVIYNTAKAFVINMLSVTSPHFLDDIKQTACTLLAKNNYPTDIISRIFAEIVSSNSVTLSQQQQWFDSIQTNVDFFPSNTSYASISASISEPTPLDTQTTQNFARLALPYIPNITEKTAEAFNTFRPDITMPTKPANPMKPIFNYHKNPKRDSEAKQDDRPLPQQPRKRARRTKAAHSLH